MNEINLSKQAEKFLTSTIPKHAKQIARKLLALQENPYPHDSIQLKGKFSKYHRADIGEYRIIYFLEDEIINVVIIDKRNDDKVYKKLDNFLS